MELLAEVALVIVQILLVVRRRLEAARSILLVSWLTRVAFDWNTLCVLCSLTQVLFATLWIDDLSGVVTLIFKVILLW